MHQENKKKGKNESRYKTGSRRWIIWRIARERDEEALPSGGGGGNVSEPLERIERLCGPPPRYMYNVSVQVDTLLPLWLDNFRAAICTSVKKNKIK